MGPGTTSRPHILCLRLIVIPSQGMLTAKMTAKGRRTESGDEIERPTTACSSRFRRLSHLRAASQKASKLLRPQPKRRGLAATGVPVKGDRLLMLVYSRTACCIEPASRRFQTDRCSEKENLLQPLHRMLYHSHAIMYCRGVEDESFRPRSRGLPSSSKRSGEGVGKDRATDLQ